MPRLIVYLVVAMALGICGNVAAGSSAKRKIDGILCELSESKIVVMVKEAKVGAAITPETIYRERRWKRSAADFKVSRRVIVLIEDRANGPVATEVRAYVPPKSINGKGH